MTHPHVKSALIPHDLAICEAENGFAERLTYEAHVLGRHPRLLRCVYCPICGLHYTAKPEKLKGWTPSIPHITCTRCSSRSGRNAPET